jgi:hypothetical protein
MGYKNQFDDETKPSATWWNGSKSGMQIWNMSQSADTMSFSIGDTANVSRYQLRCQHPTTDLLIHPG